MEVQGLGVEGLEVRLVRFEDVKFRGLGLQGVGPEIPRFLRFFIIVIQTLRKVGFQGST